MHESKERRRPTPPQANAAPGANAAFRPTPPQANAAPGANAAFRPTPPQANAAFRPTLLSLVPSLTELLCDLGLRARLIGCTKFCIHPLDLRDSVTVVGGTKDVDVEKVRALAPTLVIASKEENVREQVEAIEKFCEVLVTDIQTLADARGVIHMLGERFGVSPIAESIISANERTIAQLHRPNRGPALYLIWRKPYMAAGGDTYIHSVMEALGYANVLAKAERYPSLTPVEIKGLSPKHLLLSSEPFPFREKHIAELQALCPDAEVTLVDGERFSWYGSRLGKLTAVIPA